MSALPSLSPAVQAHDWGWRHGTRKAWAVRGLDLRIEVGERVMLLGASGAGKSTLLAGLAGLLDPEQSGGDEEGELLLDGALARRARVAAIRTGQARTGLLLQDPQAQTILARCGDDVAFGLENHAVPAGEIWSRVDDALRQVGFPYSVGHSTAALSGGQRQRLALAGVLALRPGLLLLDEPTAMLDPEGAEQIRQSVAAVLALTGAGCLLVEHRVEPWLPLIDRVVVLQPGGGVQADGPPGEVFAEQAIQLAAAGVWVPGRRLRVAKARTPVTGPAANDLAANDLAANDLAANDLAANDLAAGESGEALLTAERLAVRRPGQSEPAAADLDFAVTSGRALCVVGRNGAGKSTLALTAAGLIPPASGRLSAGARLADGLGPDPYRWRAGQLVSRIGTVFQDPQHQFVATTVVGELAVGPSRLPGAGRRSAAEGRVVTERIDELLHRLDLADLARANPFTLSGGEQRRLSVATVLATTPRLLVLDEPTFGQDARTWLELTTLLTELLAGGAAMIVASHDEELVAELAAPGVGARLAL